MQYRFVPGGTVTRRTSQWLALVLFAACAMASGSAGPGAGEPHASLRKYFSIDANDLRALDEGRIIARVEMPDERDVLIVGAVRVRASRADVVAGVGDVHASRQNDVLLAAGRINATPSPSDFASLTLEPGEVRSLEDCRPGGCDFKLGGPDIERFRHDVDWASPHAHAQAEGVMREVLARAARSYLDLGDAGLDELRDHAEPVSRGAEFLALVRRLPYLQASAPGILRRITGTPSGLRGTTDDFLYWSKADLGLKPIITLTHVAICTQGRGPNEVVIASRQIFANHYFDASLGLTALIDSSDGSGMSYLIYVNRSRIDRFPGPFGALARALVKSRLRKGVEKSLAIEKIRLERSRAETPPAGEWRHP
jgi:hypothetical protein